MVPDEFMTVIEILEYLFCLMMYQKDLILNLQYIHLKPSTQKKRYCFFYINQEYIYTQLPAFWNIEIKSDSNDYNHCPNKMHHRMNKLLNQIHVYSGCRSKCSNNFKKLKDLFLQLLQENKLNCMYCPIIEKEIQEFKDDSRYIRDFYSGFRELNFDELKQIIDPHIKYIKMILHQTRSNAIQEKIIIAVRETFFKFKTEFTQTLMDGKHVDFIHQKFAHCMKANLMTLVTFINFKDINFSDWFNSLFKFQLHLTNPEISLNVFEKEKIFMKIFSILYLLFPENNTDSIAPFILVFKENKKIKMNIILSDLSFYHPFLRGDCLTKYNFHDQNDCDQIQI
jgi:hypothetical protein